MENIIRVKSGESIREAQLKARALDYVDEIMMQETIDAIRRMDRVFTDAFI